MLDEKYKPENALEVPAEAAETQTWQQSLDEVAKRELLLLGEGQIVYFRPVSGEEYEAGTQAARLVTGLGVFSARGNLLVVCPDLETAAAFAMENNLVPVRLH